MGSAAEGQTGSIQFKPSPGKEREFSQKIIEALNFAANSYIQASRGDQKGFQSQDQGFIDRQLGEASS